MVINSKKQNSVLSVGSLLITESNRRATNRKKVLSLGVLSLIYVESGFFLIILFKILCLAEVLHFFCPASTLEAMVSHPSIGKH